jgi:Ig-like domain-containing protein/PA14 domain-containing protein
MKKKSVCSTILPITIALLLANAANAQIATNWAAFNDHSPSALTHPNATGYRMALNGDGGILRDFFTGSDLTVALVITHTGAPEAGFGATSNPNSGTPAYNLFNGIVDLGNTTPYGIVGIRSSSATTVTMTFTNLDPTKRYVFRGAAVRGGGTAAYSNRWTVVTIVGHQSAIEVHTAGAITKANFPSANLTNNQVAWNSGENRADGTLLGWDEIDPGPDGSFSLVNAQYHGPNPFNLDTSSAPYGYGMAGIYLAEVGPQSPVSITGQPADVTVEENRPFTLTVTAQGSPPPRYQWYKDNALLPGITRSTYSVARASLSDSGDYYVVAQNAINTETSRVAHVTVFEDVTKPTVVSVVSGVKLDSVVVKFSETLDPEQVADNFNFVLTDESGGGISLLEPIAASMSADGTIITLALAAGTVLQGDAPYNIKISALVDLTRREANTMDETNITFRSFTLAGCTGFLFEAFDTAPAVGTPVSLLTSHPNYPNNPRDVARISSFDSRRAYADNGHNEYGARIRGLFVPTVTGPWTFYLAADDDAQLWVNPSGPDAAGKQMVAHQNLITCCQDFQPQGNPRTSVPINLTAGQAYYIEGLYKEGGGDDWMKVAARPSGDSVPPGGVTGNIQISPVVIQGGGAPAGVLNHVTIASQPADRSVVAGRVATFSVGLSLDVPACYQWQRDGSDIAGATGPSYRLTAALGDDGAKFRVIVSLLGGTVRTSAEATLSVAPDINGPVVLSAVPGATLSEVIVTYDEPVDVQTGGDYFNYEVTGVSVTAATLVNPSTARLTLSGPMASCTRIEVTVKDVEDLYDNFIEPNPTIVSFFIPIEVLAMDANQQWKYNDSGNDPGPEWNYDTYNDSAWSSGPALLGYEPDTVVAAQPLRTPTSPNGTNKTVYFRAHFNLPTDPATVTRLQLREILDDGAVYYLNGYEVYRNRIGPGTVTHATMANAGSPENPAGTHPTQGPTDIPRDWLRYGDNVFAVSVHPNSATSSDYIFGASLTASLSDCRPPGPTLSITYSGGSVMITSSGPGTIYKSSNLVDWSVVGPSPQQLSADQPYQFFTIRP